MSQIKELDAVASLPEEIQRDADNVVNHDESLQNGVKRPCPAYKESEGEVEFHRESKHCECSVGDEVFEETLFIPSAFMWPSSSSNLSLFHMNQASRAATK